MIEYQNFLKEYKKYFNNLVPMNVMDIGGKGGIPREFNKANEIINFFSFEPNPIEFDKLNKENKTHSILPFAIGAKEEKRDLNIAEYASGSSLYNINQKTVSRFWDYENLISNKTEIIDCVSLDYLYKEKIIPVPNFIKIDVEGAEFEVLEGASNVLLNQDCLGLKIECRFDDWLIDEDNKPIKTFSEIDIYLKKLGFKLYDIHTFRHGKKPLVQPFTLFNGIKKVPGPSNYGQVVWCDAVYFKDMINNHIDNYSNNFDNYLKLILLMEIYGHLDSAIEISNFLFNKDDRFKNIMDYFKVDFYGKKMKYSKSQYFVNQINRNNNLKYWYRKKLLYQTKESIIKYFASFLPDKLNIKIKKLLRLI
jgi:FkbM family methyltransferase